MKHHPKKWSTWVASKNVYLPGVQAIFESAQTSCLIVGAAVFELYELQEWTPRLRRQTGDLDLSIGILSDSKSYESAKAILISTGYKQDALHPYRYHPPQKIPGGQTYIDLLAHPTGPRNRAFEARQAMGGVGEDFSFEGIGFAEHAAYELLPHIKVPNPLAFLFLKMVSYQKEPTVRIKDFADILECISGLVEKGTHFEMTGLWDQIHGLPEAAKLKAHLLEIANDSIRWDIDHIRSELLSRGFSDSFIDETFIQRVSDFNAYLE